MSSMLRCLVTLGILFITLPASTQRLGLLPSSTKWEQLKHDSLRILYPEGHEDQARRIASRMLQLAALDPIDTASRYKPISVILQPKTNVSNGYVGLAPYVSEIYLQPNENPFELGSLPWEDLLAVHEYRHVQQVNAINTGITHIIKVIFGEQAFLGMLGLATTNWLREGDAVWMETKYSPQGRGRLSSFTLPFRERIRTEERWNYYKLRNGSYKINVPDHYPLGYLMMQYGNHVFGENTWDTIFRLTPRINPIYDPNSGVIKKFYGKSNKHLYFGAMDFFGAQWKNEASEDIEYPQIPITEKNKKAALFDMAYPALDEEGNIYCAITSFDSTAALYKIYPDGHREKVRTLGLNHSSIFDQQAHKLVWTEVRLDPRWIRQDKNVLVLYDELHKNKRIIVPEKGYFMPRLDSKGDKIVALHADEFGRYNLHIIDAASPHLVKTLPNPENYYLGYPLFSEDGQHIIATARNTQGRMCLVRQDIETGMITQITHFSYQILGRPEEAGPWIYLSTNLDVIDQVFAVDKHEGIFYRVSGGNRAHYDPAWDPVRGEIICAEYTNNGKKLVRVNADSEHWMMVNLDDHIPDIPGASLRNLITEPIRNDGFEIKRYNPWSNVINFHSWKITANDPVWGIEFQSNNILNSMSMAVGYDYNRNNDSHGPYANIRMGMWFPEIVFGYSSRRQNVYNTHGEQFKAKNTELSTGISIPLVFTSGSYNQTFNITSTINQGISKLDQEPNLSQELKYTYFNHQLLFTNGKLKAHRQPNPSFGQFLDLSFSRNIGQEKINQFYGRTFFALPSFKPSHYLILGGEYLGQKTDNNYVQLGSRYAGPRGFDIPDGNENYTLSLTYGFPLVYPDVGFGSIAYLRRLRIQPFFDYGFTDYNGIPDDYLLSAGAEALFDFEFAHLTVGLRFTRLISGTRSDPFVFEIFLPVQRF